MSRYARSHLADQTLLRAALAHAASERTATADLLADLAEIDARQLYLPAAYPSLFAYCLGELKLSEDAAAKRIQAARAARRFPVILEALAEGRLHLTGVGLLAPYLTEETAGPLLAAAMGQSKAQIEQLLAERFPQSDLLAWVAPIPAAPAGGPADGAANQHAPAHVERPSAPAEAEAKQHAPAHVDSGPVPTPSDPRPRVKPLSAQSFAVQFTMSRGAHDKLRYAQELLGDQIPAGDIAAVIERALDALIPQLEKIKFAATEHPRRGPCRGSDNPRHVPAHVKRAVWERDQGRCTFVSETGRRCEARRGLQFDHVTEVARGGEATASNVRLLCRAHNQYRAERTFGAEFMRHKRIAASETRAEKVRGTWQGSAAGP